VSRYVHCSNVTSRHITVLSQLVLVSLELSLAAPFLLDLLPRVTIGRREGKAAVDSGYGAPESSAYEAPKPSYSTTTTTTVRPCSYEAPTTTSAPSYGAPEQKKAGFPDILGFIGGILKPKKAPEPSTGYGCLSPPVDSGYGAPQSDAYEAPQADAYEAPQSDAYEAPQSDAYEAPQSDAYEAPQSDVYEAPKSDAYEAPKSDAYEAPKSDAYEAPQSDAYDAPDYQGVAVNERSNAPSA